MDHKDKIKAYKRLFSTDDGKTVLEDLFSRFGFDAEGVERPSVRIGHGQTHADLATLEGMKEPIRYILRLRNENPDNPPRKGEALNGSKI